MDKIGLLNWLELRHKEWREVTNQFTDVTWEKSGVAGYWSMKDVLAHLTGWNKKLVGDMKAKRDDLPPPLPPWPADLEEDNDVNAWIYENNRNRSVSELLKEEEEVFGEVVKFVKSLPDDVKIETRHNEDREFHLIHINDKLLHPGEFFDHYRDDHEPKICAFLTEHGSNRI